MEKIKVENFLVLKDIELTINKINVIIGSQANGKSLIAKLLYFFRDFLSTTYLNSIQELHNKKDVEREGLLKFERFFPKYAWKGQEFKLVYQIEDYEVTITNKKNSSIKLDYSGSLVSLHKKTKNAYRKAQTEKFQLENDVDEVFFDPFEHAVKQHILNNNQSNCFRNSIFIPASRSFFANLQKNVFSFLASNIDIDPFIKDFGSQYEQSKRYYANSYFRKQGRNQKLSEKIEDIIENILVGKYEQESDKDWITNRGKRVNLSNASSGQQEALPMLLILSIWPFIRARKSTFFIEEPEAHLFPISQKHIVSLLSLIHNEFNNNLIITTHSPYILTALNNNILTKDVTDLKGFEAVSKITDPSLGIDFEKVSAYTIKNGRLTNIMDKDLRLISSSVIDSVSEEFDKVFDSLLTLQMSKT